MDSYAAYSRKNSNSVLGKRRRSTVDDDTRQFLSRLQVDQPKPKRVCRIVEKLDQNKRGEVLVMSGTTRGNVGDDECPVNDPTLLFGEDTAIDAVSGINGSVLFIRDTNLPGSSAPTMVDPIIPIWKACVMENNGPDEQKLTMIRTVPKTTEAEAASGEPIRLVDTTHLLVAVVNRETGRVLSVVNKLGVAHSGMETSKTWRGPWAIPITEYGRL